MVLGNTALDILLLVLFIHTDTEATKTVLKLEYIRPSPQDLKEIQVTAKACVKI